MLATKPGSSTKVTSVLNLRAISPAPLLCVTALFHALLFNILEVFHHEGTRVRMESLDITVLCPWRRPRTGGNLAN